MLNKFFLALIFIIGKSYANPVYDRINSHPVLIMLEPTKENCEKFEKYKKDVIFLGQGKCKDFYNLKGKDAEIFQKIILRGRNALVMYRAAEIPTNMSNNIQDFPVKILEQANIYYNSFGNTLPKPGFGEKLNSELSNFNGLITYVRDGCPACDSEKQDLIKLCNINSEDIIILYSRDTKNKICNGQFNRSLGTTIGVKGTPTHIFLMDGKIFYYKTGYMQNIIQFTESLREVNSKYKVR